ncbi:hypothetical protein ZHAS_00005190 [Anopheles sinensis]|uniref:Uncharacterized protein n=1 Tax=Anopheles sinensis TaxID=74873 RepID=A0A084VIS9_ANOSI|nr:hypothetical protein ZHAS_00005190 [Anopheles sinensis]
MVRVFEQRSSSIRQPSALDWVPNEVIMNSQSDDGHRMTSLYPYHIIGQNRPTSTIGDGQRAWGEGPATGPRLVTIGQACPIGGCQAGESTRTPEPNKS